MKINYHNKKFKPVVNSDNGEVGAFTVFTYYQKENILWATYEGGQIRFGTITGLVQEDGKLEFSYQHVNLQNELMTGQCISTPEILDNGKIILHEQWKWTSGDLTSGVSVVEEF